MLGRSGSLTRIDALLESALAGRAATLLIVGEAGIGKTTLLDASLARAEGFTRLHGAGVEEEAALPFAGLSRLVRPLRAEIDLLASDQAAVLRGALGLGPPSPLGGLAAPTALLALLATAAERAPLLVVVDDTHWLDPISLRALLFAARRLSADRVALLLARRPVPGLGDGDLPFL